MKHAVVRVESKIGFKELRPEPKLLNRGLRLGTFPKDFPKRHLPRGIFPSGNLPKCAISQAATSHYLNNIWGNLSLSLLQSLPTSSMKLVRGESWTNRVGSFPCLRRACSSNDLRKKSNKIRRSFNRKKSLT